MACQAMCMFSPDIWTGEPLAVKEERANLTAVPPGWLMFHNFLIVKVIKVKEKKKRLCDSEFDPLTIKDIILTLGKTPLVYED